MRKKIIAANWKMNMTVSEAEAFLSTFLHELGSESSVEVVIVPPFTALAKVSEILGRGQQAKLGAQNMSAEKSGAYTGEISAQMLRELYVRYVVIGHSERRTLFGETDETVNRKVRAAIEAALKPIVCIGETLEQRDADQVESVLHRQIEAGLQGLTARELGDTVIAYEPVWAIGTGEVATPADAQEVCGAIRARIREVHGSAADQTRILYGGSMKADNVAALMLEADIDGGLVGGASLDPDEFVSVCRYRLHA